MPVESRIDADDDWFVGESKVLRFTVTVPAGTTDFTDWSVRWRLYDRKNVLVMEKLSSANEVVLSEVTADSVTTRYAAVQVAADDYDAVSAGTYQHSLWRIDPGSEAVLSFGPVVIQSDVDA